MKSFLVSFALALGCAQAAGAAEARLAYGPAASTTGGATTITFAMAAPADVEVAIIDARGAVVRHLAAGFLGGRQPPPAPLVPGLTQTLAWDGKDDYGQKVAGGPFTARVRAGMGVKLDRIVGGDPYAYFSREMGQGDHAAWRMTGLEAKPDGTVYLLGNANHYGPPALRAYKADGEYLRTVYPPPAGKNPEQVKGWGTVEKSDGDYAFEFKDLSSPALSKTIIGGTRGRIARIVPSSEPDKLLVESNGRLLRINGDGTLERQPGVTGEIVDNPPMRGAGGARTLGPSQITLTPDRSGFHMAGVMAPRLAGTRRTGVETTGFWRDGQVYKVDGATREAEVFFALPEGSIPGGEAERSRSPIGDTRYGAYAALHGVATDGAGRVFVTDRMNRRILALAPDGKLLREIPCAEPDVVAVHPREPILYVTTRGGHYHEAGKLTLLRFGDWTRDDAPSAILPLCQVRAYNQPTLLAVAESGGDVFLWVAYTELPVRVYRESGGALDLVRDFYEAGDRQRLLDMQHMAVDPVGGGVFFAEGFNRMFKLTDWSAPRFEPCLEAPGKPLPGISLAIDARRRHLYAHGDRSAVTRYELDGAFHAPAPPEGGANAFSPRISNDWRIGLGFGDRGIAVGPDGGVVTLNAIGRGPDYGGYLRYHAAAPGAGAGEGLLFKSFGAPARMAGARFDPRGNLYVGKSEGNAVYGRIYKFAPTGSLREGDLFPSEPDAPAKVYDVAYGAIAPQFTRTPRFGVDGYGRIYYPTSLQPRVSVIDNEGNALLSFGTYGNRDSMGGLPGDLAPTRDVPMAWPNSVDATDDFIYVSDIVNIRLLRLAKTFAAEMTVKLP
jgi:hypothetical protein